MSAKYKSPSFLLPNELNTSTNPLNTDGNPATGTGVNSLYSMDLDVGNKYIDCGNGLGDSLGTYTGDLSFSFWINRPTAVDSRGILYFGSFSNARGVLEIYADANSITILSGGSKYINYTNTNTWDNICIVYKSGDISNSKIYLNGSEQSTTDIGSFSSSLSFTGKKTIIGGYFGSANTFNGKIDEVAIFNKALNTTEISALYGGTSPNIYPSNIMATDLNPVAYYPLGEQAQNSGYLGSSGNEWQFPNGVLQDYVMDFDGSDKINCGPAKAYNIVTLSAWVKPNSPPNYAGIFGTRNLSAVVLPYHLGIASNKFRFIVTDSTGLKEIAANTSFSNNVWYHVMGVADGSTTKLYIDGVLQTATGSYNGTISTPDDDLMIGAQTSIDTSFEWVGQISNVAIWNTAITDANQIANIYNNGSPQTSYTVTPQNWWKLNATSVYTPSAPSYTTALDFNSTKSDLDYVQFGNTSLSLPASLSFWLKPLGIAPNGYGMPYSDSSGQIYWATGSGGMKYEVTLAGAPKIISTVILTADVGGWHHLVVTFTSTATKLYLDGQLNASGSGGTGTNFGQDINIGRWKQYPTNILYGFDGSISNFAIINSELSASQVSTLFNFGTPETNISLSPIHNWKLDNLTTGLNDVGSLASNNGTAGSVNGTGPVQESTSVVVIPSWKIPSALPIATPNYTTALDFNGNGDYVTLNSSINLTGNKTVSYWVNPNSFGDVYIGGVQGIDYYTYMTSSLLYIKDSTGFDAFNITGHISTGSWYHICITGDGTNATLYINGDFISTINDKNPTIDAIGAYNNGGYSADAKMSNVQIFNSALPATGSNSVETLYNNGSPLTSMSGFTSLQGWWKLDSTTITDSAGSNNGTNSSPGAAQVTSDVLTPQPVNGVSTTLPSTALQQSDLQFDSPYSNYSLKFSTSQSIDTNFTLPASYTSYSYSFWYRSTAASIGTGDYYIISNFDSSNTNLSGTRGAVRFNNSTKMRIFGGDNTNYYLRQYEVGSSLLDQQWHNVVVTFTNTEVLLYVDGVSISAETTTNTPITGFAANRSYTIGQSGINSGYLINSKLDEFAIFDKKLTEAEILSIYNNGKPSDISPIAPTNWWRLGENAYFVNNDITLPNSVSGAPNGVSSGTATSMLSADAPGTYANGVGTNLDIVDRVGDAALSTANSQSYNMIPDDKVPYVPGYIGAQISNTSEMTFDGTNYFNAGNNSSLNWGSGNGTVSCWFKTSYNAPGVQDLVINGSYASGGKGYILYLDPSERVGFALDDNSNPSGVLSTSSVNDGDWHHVVGVRDSGTMKLYLDGSEVATGTDNTGNIDISDPLIIGAGQAFGGSVGNFFNGQIDEVAIFNKALTADQIKFDLYSATTTGKTADIANNPNLPTPVAWYRMGD